jgi:K+-transporting ATPase KdpF subunit
VIVITIVAGLLGLASLGYLVWALVRPEQF